MALDVTTVMKKQDMQRLLMKSKSEPVNFAFGQGDDPSSALLLLERVKQGRAVETELGNKFPTVKNTRYGIAMVDVEQDPKLVQFFVNKPISGVARKLVKTLKGTGFSKAKILLNDGTAVDGFEEEETAAPVALNDGAETQADPAAPQPAAADESAAAPGGQSDNAADTPPSPAASASAAAPGAQPSGAADAAASAAAGGSAAAPGPQPGSAPDASAPTAAGTNAAVVDVGALTKALGALIKRIAQADPSRQELLKNLARQAGQALKTDGGADAPDAIKLLTFELGKSVPSSGAAPAAGADIIRSAVPGATQGLAGPITSVLGPSPVYAKAGLAWGKIRDKMASDIDGVRTTFTSAFQDHPMVADLSAAFKARVDQMLGQFAGEDLAQKLDAVGKATDPAARAAALSEAKQAVEHYQQVIADNQTLAELEGNPFVPLKGFRDSLTARVAVIEKTLA